MGGNHRGHRIPGSTILRLPHMLDSRLVSLACRSNSMTCITKGVRRAWNFSQEQRAATWASLLSSVLSLYLKYPIRKALQE
eukprot:6271615-Amphidinium_carterae.1